MSNPEDRWTITLENDRAVRPVGDQIVVKPLTPEERSRGGIIIPDSAQAHPLVGIVLAAGPGRLSEAGVRLPMEVKAGDTVAFNRYSGRHIKRGDKDALLIMSMDDVVATIEGIKHGNACPACGQNTVVDAEVV